MLLIWEKKNFLLPIIPQAYLLTTRLFAFSRLDHKCVPFQKLLFFRCTAGSKRFQNCDCKTLYYWTDIFQPETILPCCSNESALLSVIEEFHCAKCIRHRLYPETLKKLISYKCQHNQYLISLMLCRMKIIKIAKGIATSLCVPQVMNINKACEERHNKTPVLYNWMQTAF